MLVLMSRKVNHSAFRTPRSGNHRVHASPPVLHIPAYISGGVGKLYNDIRDGCQEQMEKYGMFTDEKGVFNPRVGMPLLAARYRYLTILGKGQSSVLVKAEDTFNSDVKVSIKVLHTHNISLGAQEVDCLCKLNLADPHGYSAIIKLQNIFMYDDHYCMVFELLNPKPLTLHFKKITCKHKKMKVIRKVTLQLLQAIGFLQQQNVIHADLKPDNILLEDECNFRHLKVVDFGNAIQCIYDELSLYYDDFELQAFLYRAPEVMFGLPFGLEVDLWSLGCILSELYKGEPLFYGRTPKGVLTKMTGLLGPVPLMYQKGKFFGNLEMFVGPPTKENVTLALMKELDTDDYTFADFISGLLQYDPNERMTVSMAAQHHFMAPELAIKFLLPQPHGPDKRNGYSKIQLTEETYRYSPAIGNDVCKLYLSSLELLRFGTQTQASSAANEVSHTAKKIAQIVPLVHASKHKGQLHLSNVVHNRCSPMHVELPKVDDCMNINQSKDSQMSGVDKNSLTASSAAFSMRNCKDKIYNVVQPSCTVSSSQDISNTALTSSERNGMQQSSWANNVQSLTTLSQVKPVTTQVNSLPCAADLTHVRTACPSHKGRNLVDLQQAEYHLLSSSQEAMKPKNFYNVQLSSGSHSYETVKGKSCGVLGVKNDDKEKKDLLETCGGSSRGYTERDEKRYSWLQHKFSDVFSSEETIGKRHSELLPMSACASGGSKNKIEYSSVVHSAREGEMSSNHRHGHAHPSHDSSQSQLVTETTNISDSGVKYSPLYKNEVHKHLFGVTRESTGGYLTGCQKSYKNKECHSDGGATVSDSVRQRAEMARNADTEHCHVTTDVKHSETKLFLLGSNKYQAKISPQKESSGSCVKVTSKKWTTQKEKRTCDSESELMSSSESIVSIISYSSSEDDSEFDQEMERTDVERLNEHQVIVSSSSIRSDNGNKTKSSVPQGSTFRAKSHSGKQEPRAEVHDQFVIERSLYSVPDPYVPKKESESGKFKKQKHGSGHHKLKKRIRMEVESKHILELRGDRHETNRLKSERSMLHRTSVNKQRKPKHHSPVTPDCHRIALQCSETSDDDENEPDYRIMSPARKCHLPEYKEKRTSKHATETSRKPQRQSQASHPSKVIKLSSLMSVPDDVLLS